MARLRLCGDKARLGSTRAAVRIDSGPETPDWIGSITSGGEGEGGDKGVGLGPFFLLWTKMHRAGRISAYLGLWSQLLA